MLSQSGFAPKIYHTRGEYANHYTTKAVNKIWKIANFMQELGGVALCYSKQDHVNLLKQNGDDRRSALTNAIDPN